MSQVEDNNSIVNKISNKDKNQNKQNSCSRQDQSKDSLLDNIKHEANKTQCLKSSSEVEKTED